jgi:hypothetical protein
MILKVQIQTIASKPISSHRTARSRDERREENKPDKVLEVAMKSRSIHKPFSQPLLTTHCQTAEIIMI